MGIVFLRIVEKHEKLQKSEPRKNLMARGIKQLCLSPVQIIYGLLIELFIECLSTVAAVTHLQGMFIPSLTFN